MKKFALAAVAAAAVLSAGVAQAYTVGTFSNGVVVPNVIQNGATDTTAVGLINQSGSTVSVFWTFFDVNSNHVTDSCFTMTDKDYQPFVWASQAGAGLAGQRGYLVFSSVKVDPVTAPACSATAALVTPNGLIAANAFQVNTATQTLAFTPVIDGPLTFAGSTDLTVMGADSLTTVAGAAQISPGTGPTFSLRYYVDGATGGNDTAIAVWSTGNQSGQHTVNMYDDAQNRKSVNFVLANSELDSFNPETIVGRPSTYVDGFIEWNAGVAAASGMTPPTATSLAAGGSVFSYSLIAAPAFGAIQSVLGAYLP